MASLSTNVRISSMENNQKKTTSDRAGTRNFGLQAEEKKWCQSETKALQAGWSIPLITHTRTHTAFWKKSALSRHFLMTEWVWMIRMWCLNKTLITLHLMITYTHTHTHKTMLRCCASLSSVIFLFCSYRGTNSHDCNKAKEYQMQWKFLYVSKTPLVSTGAAFFCIPAIYSL